MVVPSSSRQMTRSLPVTSILLLLVLAVLAVVSCSVHADSSSIDTLSDEAETDFPPLQFSAEEGESDDLHSEEFEDAHDPSAFLELDAELSAEAEAELELENAPEQTHLEHLLALQDKYTSGAVPSEAVANAFVNDPDLQMTAEMASPSTAPAVDDHMLVETQQSAEAQAGVGLSVGASAEVQAAVAAGVDMSSESQMEAQLESLAAAQQTTDRAATQTAVEAQTKNLLSFFWGSTPHKVWHDKADWQSQARHAAKRPSYIHPHKFEYMKAAKKVPHSAQLPKDQKPAPSTRLGRLPAPFAADRMSVTKTPAFAEFQRNTVNGRPRYIHKAGKSTKQLLSFKSTLSPPTIGQREVFWLSMGPKRYSYNGAAGRSYPFHSVDEAKSACLAVGADLASREQLQAAYKAGAEWCACGAVAEGSWGFPMQRRVAGCGTGKGTNEVCKAGGATCYGFKPSRASLAKLTPGSVIAPFRPNQWNEDAFAGLNAKCLHESPWSIKKCLRKAWKIAGCSRRGTRNPSTEASAVLWNQMGSWAEVVADIKRIAANDVPGGATANQCKGPREVFFYSTGPKRFIWNGQAGDGYPFNSRKHAQKACASIGATLATSEQLQEAWNEGAEWCMCGALSNSDKWSFPMQHSIKGCGSKKGVIRTCSAGGATCYGVKPGKGRVPGISAFKPGQWHQDRWTPLVKRCSHEPPFSLSKCIRPAWKLAGCTKLGADFPRKGSKVVQAWNSMSWDSLREDMLNRARTNPASCSSKFAVLDGACNHPPPYSTKRCLRPALRLAGCDKFGFIWPSRRAKTGIWWNTQKWSTVVQDIQNWAHADLYEKRESHRGGCKGLKEVFWYSGGPAASYQFSNSKEAEIACASIGSALATPEQVAASYAAGAEWCAAGFTTDGQARYPIQTPRTGCASEAGVAVWSSASKGGATCYGFKPNPKEVTGLLPFNPRTRFSQVREWKVTPSTKCSRQCGGGRQHRKVQCINSLNGKVRPDHTCRSLGPKPPRKAACNTNVCEYDWKKSSWTDCSVSCANSENRNGGNQTRTIRCIQSSTGNEFPESKCLALGEDKPRTARSCNTHSCVSYHWKIAPWEECSTECGKGTQSRKVLCVGSDRKVHEDDRCTLANGPKPADQQACNTQVCPTFSWKKQPWADCSLSCGGGKTSRKVECVGSDGSVQSDLKCSSLPAAGNKPRTIKGCNTAACLTYTWNRGAWSNCTRTCGGGSSTRVVNCQDSQNRTAEDAACASQGPQPRTVRACSTIPCRDFNWFTHRWTDCSASCGTGSQTRQVVCVGDDGSLAKDAQCVNAGPKKETKQACNTKPCVVLNWKLKKSAAATAAHSLLQLTDSNTTVSEGWSECSAKCGGGVQTRTFECLASDGSSRDQVACETVLGSTPAMKQACNTQACVVYDFKPSAWSDCSLSCGGGIRTRSARCVGSDGSVVADSVCLATGVKKPRTQGVCGTNPCEGFTWIVGAYSTCDASCGGGLQLRKVTCQGSSGKTYDDKHCAAVGYDKPESARPCNTHKCVEKRWRISQWDSCDRSCGGGETHRSVSCFGTDGKSYSDQDCLDSYLARNTTLTIAQVKKPRVVKACATQACESLFWDAAIWNKCSNRCGGGIQSRAVTCMSSSGVEKADSLCANLAAKPVSSRICNTHTCATYKLDVGKWDDCSVSCGGGNQERSVVCISSTGRRVTNATIMAERCPPTPDLDQLCNTQACLNKDEQGWVVKPWNKCDAQCGGGVQQRLVTCVSQNDPTCASFGPKPVAERACNIQACTVYEWATSEWSECSRSCGANGVQTREVRCKGSDGSRHNRFSKCKNSGVQPSSTKECLQNPCISYYWKASEWSTCSKSCGSGASTREVYCQGSDGAKRPDEACATQGAKPESTKVCNSQNCETHEFQVGAWESCSVGCGSGVQTRTVECRSTTTSKLVDASKCTSGDKDAPISQRPCNTLPCITYYWQLGQFGECSNTCNGGFRGRSVTCMGSDGAKYKDDFCLTYSYKAPTQEICNTNPCGNFTWSPEPVWTSCSVSCDAGIQTRPVRCIGPDGNKWHRSVCLNDTLKLGLELAEPTQECNTHACMTTMWDVTPWSKCTKRCAGGKQVRAVTCRKADGTRIPDRVCARLSPKPSETQNCNSQACPTYSWNADEFDDCSVSCGGGVATREVRCENNFGTRVSARHCYRLGLKRPEASETCNTQPCLSASSWSIDPWQPCSAECGTGTRIRSVNCRVGNNSTDKDCKSILPMPVVSENCNTHPCLSYRWEPTRWSVCSKSCDDEASMKVRNSTESTAIQTRQLRCLASDGSYVSRRRCLEHLTGTTPETSRVCTTNTLCRRYRWVFGRWTKCSAKCGSKGHQNRAVYCADENGTKVKKALCVYSGPKPYSARRCNSYKCVRKYKWKKGAWRDCTKSCGPNGGVATRDVTCLDKFGSSVNKQACIVTAGTEPRSSKVCNKKPCVSYKWATQAWQNCSAWCGGGAQSRKITCAGSDGRVHKDMYCAMTNGEKAETQRVCNTVPCVVGHWKKAAWGECSRSCGGGTRKRSVACVGSDGSVLPDKACQKDGPKPRTRGECNKQKCLTTSWFIGSWSKCSAKCGSGVQSREVACVGSDGVVKADINCQYAGAKAPKEQACNTYPCSAYVRKYTEWSDCSSSCGGGHQSRRSTCFNTASDRVTRKSDKCDHIPLQALAQACNTQPCLTYQWKIATWSKCTAECGGGEKSRAVTCVGSDGKEVDDAPCLLITAKPDVKRSCHTTPCNSENLFGWKVSEYGQCSHTCNTGHQARTVSCIRKSSGENVAESNCNSKRPPVNRKCNTQACVSFNWKVLTPFGSCSKTCGGGIRTREVVCVNQKGLFVDKASCKGVGSKPRSKEVCNTQPCVKEEMVDPEEPVKKKKKAKKVKKGPKPVTATLYKHRKRRSKSAALALTDPDAARRAAEESGLPTKKKKSPERAPKWAHVGMLDDYEMNMLLDAAYGVNDPTLKQAMAKAVKASASDLLDERFDSKHLDGSPRSATELAARQSLRIKLLAARAAAASRAYVGPKLSEEDELKEVYDMYDNRGYPRTATQIAARRAKRLKLAAEKEKKDPLSEMYDSIDPKSGKPRTPAQISARKLARAKRTAEQLQAKLSLARSAQVRRAQRAEKARKKAARAAKKKGLALDVNGKPVKAKLVFDKNGKLLKALPVDPKTGKVDKAAIAAPAGPPLAVYNADGSCSDSRGCQLGGGDDSVVTPAEAIKMLPVVPQYHEVEVDEYEG